MTRARATSCVLLLVLLTSAGCAHRRVARASDTTLPDIPPLPDGEVLELSLELASVGRALDVCSHALVALSNSYTSDGYTIEQNTGTTIVARRGSRRIQVRVSVECTGRQVTTRILGQFRGTPGDRIRWQHELTTTLSERLDFADVPPPSRPRPPTHWLLPIGMPVLFAASGVIAAGGLGLDAYIRNPISLSSSPRGTPTVSFGVIPAIISGLLITTGIVLGIVGAVLDDAQSVGDKPARRTDISLTAGPGDVGLGLQLTL